MTIHDVDERLAFSHKAEDLPFWPCIYREAFPDVVRVESLRHDLRQQRLGNDRRLYMRSGKTLHVDEKVREKDYGDFAIEDHHEYPDGRTKIGWAKKELWCDFIAYAVLPLNTAWLLPTQALQRAWRLNRNNWVLRMMAGESGFRRVAAPNRCYVSVSLSVPRGVLLQAIGEATCICWAQTLAPTPEPCVSPEEEIQW